MLFSNLLDGYTEYKALASHIEKRETPVSVSGVVESANAQLIASLAERFERSVLVLAANDADAKALTEDLRFYTDRAALFPSKDYIFYDIDTAAHVNEHGRLSVLERLCGGEKIIAVASVDALLSYTAEPELYRKSRITFKVGATLDLEDLTARLVDMGYRREDMVEGVGQFSVRGGILDIYCPSQQFPVRIEFFDTEIDSVRTFDPLTQRSLEKVSAFTAAPCTEAILTQEKAVELIDALKKEIARLKRKKSDQSAAIEVLGSDIEKLTQTHLFPAIDKYVSLIYGHIPTLADYFNEDSLVFVLDPKRVNERVKTFIWEREEQLSGLSDKGQIIYEGMQFYADYSSIAAALSQRRMTALNVLSHTSLDYTYRALVSFVTKSTVSFHGKLDYLIDDLRGWKENGSTVVILAANRARGENLVDTLRERGFECRYMHEASAFEKGETVVVRGELGKGFEYPDLHFVLISDQEIFASKRKRRRRMENANRLKSFNDISAGDYVVHQTHGIGQYVGMEKKTVTGITKDYLKIQYQGTDCLYVPVDQLDMLYKYTGNTEMKVRVNKLGGTDWTKTKARVKAATADMAKHLLALYASREKSRGYAFSADAPWQRDFEDTFAYQETEDQLKSIEEVKKDMESVHPMDRLLCGDVGYGKTEVAIRAAFKAATDGKQVAYLCPTTILAMQQYETFSSRMAPFPVRVQMLSRFRTASQQKQILKQLKTGEIDVLIGTHRLLQKDVQFKDLGLLIVDEEQRFGVAHKERMKELKNNIDVLTMTATPIPRTLHMAMVNIRDMSVLTEPPEDRYPVQTYVLEYHRDILVDAMRKELSRGGQVFYLFNRVQGIYRVAAWIREAIPEARVAVGHGKMNEDELEDIMYSMVNGETDILVCTTIIETGLDIPNANTIIIENADRMGLSQLYQLRGRVGRSNRAAYAYFTYHKDKVLTEVAQKRLRAIKDFTEFGSGFKIAMRDLEIRGAGNLLGAEQHGHMDAVGYDMYCKLLKESVDEARGEAETEDMQVLIDLDISAYIPENYIRSSDQRIDIYKKIAAIADDEDKMEIEDELIDRYGDIPRPVMSLIAVASMKAMAREAGVEHIRQAAERVILTFAVGQMTPELFFELSKKYPNRIKPVPQEEMSLSYRLESKKSILDNIKFLLQDIKELKKTDKQGIMN